MLKSFATLLALSLLLAATSGCMRMASGVHYIPEKFYCKSYLPEGKKVQLRRHHEKSFSGFNLMLLQLKTPSIEAFFENLQAGLQDNEYLTNVSIHNTSQTFAYVQYLFTIPVVNVEADVVRIVDED